jgi:hypothetical protein
MAASSRAEPRYRRSVRNVLAFYRARPLVGILVFVVGLAVAVTTVSLQKDDDGFVLPIAFLAAAGLVVGLVVAYGTRGRRRD